MGRAVTFRAVENITHSLVGATLAELALPAGSRTVQRRLFFFTGIVAANLPDGDLVYTRISPPPLGYLLHHRGHTHTLVGCVVLGLFAWLVVRLIPPVRRLVAEAPRNFWLLVAVALASHLVLDSWNSYGVHPFWPFDNRWFYGDAIYIIDPWLWMMLGVAIVANARSTTRRSVLAAGLIGLPLALAGLRMMQTGALVALGVIGAALGAATFRARPRVRSSVAMGAALFYVAAMFGLSHVARGVSVAGIRSIQSSDGGGDIVDIVLNPNLAMPFCWSALAIERSESRDEYVLRRGSVSLFDGVCGRTGTEWFVSSRQPLARLRERNRQDCWVRAWLQFGRAPVMGNDDIVDYRFGGEGRGNFTSMRLLDSTLARVCPPHLTNWVPPRADLLGKALEN